METRASDESPGEVQSGAVVSYTEEEGEGEEEERRDRPVYSLWCVFLTVLPDIMQMYISISSVLLIGTSIVCLE